MTSTDIFFYIFSTTALIFALGVIFSKNPISSAFSLVAVFFCVAADYALLQAHFIAALQILVYAGAIMVLFVFVIMLLNADVRSVNVGKKQGIQIASALLCAILLSIFIWGILHSTMATVKSGLTPEKIINLGGNVQVISESMFSDYILPFELTSLLLLVGIIGSVSLAKRRLH